MVAQINKAANPDIIGRLAILQNGHLLLAHFRDEKYTFLPGGHVMPDEGIKAAIRRELWEEFNGRVEIDRYICTLEHSFYNNDKKQNEISFVFSGKLLNCTYPQKPGSCEIDLEFFWRSIDKLNEANLLPQPLRHVLPDFFNDNNSGLWISTIEP